jgi:Chaperone of endosialidase
MSRSSASLGLLFSFASLAVPAVAQAQPVGTFRWQMQPFCNVLTINVTQSGAVFALDGFDDQCGAETRAPLTGTAAPNPNGTIALGINIVTSPGAAPLHVAVPLNAGTLGGTWRDSAGHTGNFVFTRGAGTGGTPRPSSGPIGAIHVNPAQVQLRVAGACPAGQLVQRINQDGSVACVAAAAAAGDITAVTTAAGSGLQGGAEAGAANLRIAATSSGAFDLSNDNGFVAAGELSVGAVPATVSGPRFMWYPAKAAFRAGYVHQPQFEEADIGMYSVAMGAIVAAPGDAGIALGYRAGAVGASGVAIGESVSASAPWSLALGSNVHVNPDHSGSIIIGDSSFAGPFGLASSGPNQFTVRAAGGYRLFSSSTLSSGVTLAPGASAWASISDVNLKENFRDLDDEDVLAKIAEMPIREWNYKAQDAGIRHVGPTAQDYYAAFGLGEDPLRISTIDADGIALRAIQALEAMTRAYEARIQALEQELAAMRDRAGVSR